MAGDRGEARFGRVHAAEQLGIARARAGERTFATSAAASPLLAMSTRACCHDGSSFLADVIAAVCTFARVRMVGIVGGVG